MANYYVRRFAITGLTLLFTSTVWGDFGMESASFLDIPVGAAPASLAGAYSALANDAYAPTYNPGGLGLLPSTQVSAQHLSYLESINYEYASFAHPFRSSADRSTGAIGAAVQYLSPGSIQARDDTGTATGEFSGYYSAYTLSYGYPVTDRLGLGASGKIIHAKIADVTGTSYAADFGSFYRMKDSWTAAATLTNLGTRLTFLNEGQAPPTAFHLGLAGSPIQHWLTTVEGVFPTRAAASLHGGVEWQPVRWGQIRAGYRTDTLKSASAIAGMTVGAGLHIWEQDVAYAWVPYGDLGSTQYFSFVFRFGAHSAQDGNVLQDSRTSVPLERGYSL